MQLPPAGAAGVTESTPPPPPPHPNPGPSVYVVMCNVEWVPGDDLVDQGVGLGRRGTVLHDACGGTVPTEQKKYQATARNHG